MGLVRTWSRQVARAAGASLIAPLALLLAAGVVASGGGLGGLGSLGQITSGPSLPETGLTTPSSASIERAEIVGAVAPAASESPRSAPPAGQLASAAPPPGAASRRAAEAAGRQRVTKYRSRAERPTRGSRLTDANEVSVVQDPGDRSGLVEGLQETTSGLGESLSEPLQPVTNQLVDLLRLLAPPPR